MTAWITIGCAACLLLGCVGRTPPPSSHHDGTRFFNPEGPGHSTRDMLRWLWEMETVPWPEWVEDPPQPPPPERVGRGALHVTHVNHATVLIQLDGANVLTDPIWSARAGPVSWLGAKRVRAPGVPFEALPRIDLVLLSHDHYDHLDLPTLARLERRDHPTFVAGLGVARRLRSLKLPAARVIELDWWQAHEHARTGARVLFVPARHGSGRGPFTEDRTLWGGFVLAGEEGDVYFAGDTGLGAFVDELAARVPRVRLAILPIGSYERRWFMKAQHLSPEDAVGLHRTLGARQSMGIHYATFAEHPEQALDAHERDLAAALAAQGVDPDRFWILGFGEGREVSPGTGTR